MTEHHAAQLDAVLHALSQGDHEAADALAALAPDELAGLMADDGGGPAGAADKLAT